MNRERHKKISTALASLTLAILPADVREGIAAIADELREQDERIAAVERAVYGETPAVFAGGGDFGGATHG